MSDSCDWLNSFQQRFSAVERWFRSVYSLYEATAQCFHSHRHTQTHTSVPQLGEPGNSSAEKLRATGYSSPHTHTHLGACVRDPLTFIPFTSTDLKTLRVRSAPGYRACVCVCVCVGVCVFSDLFSLFCSPRVGHLSTHAGFLPPIPRQPGTL